MQGKFNDLNSVPRAWLAHRNYMQAQLAKGETFLSFREWSEQQKAYEHVHTTTTEYEQVCQGEYEITSHTYCLDCGAEIKPVAEPFSYNSVLPF